MVYKQKGKITSENILFAFLQPNQLVFVIGQRKTNKNQILHFYQEKSGLNKSIINYFLPLYHYEFFFFLVTLDGSS
jgi:hypothetical protein